MDTSEVPVLLPPGAPSGEPAAVGMDTPESVSSLQGSFTDHSPVAPSIAHTESYLGARSSSQINLVKTENIEKTTSLSSIKTFSSDEEDEVTGNLSNLHEDDDLFEHYNGSIQDLAEEVQPILKSSPPIQPIEVIKTRESAPETNHNKKLRNLTPVDPRRSSSETVTIEKITSLESQFDQLNRKYYKLEREILYVDEMLSHQHSSKTLESQKLSYARGKLMDRLQSTKKERYDIGVSLSKLRRKVYGDDSGDMTEYFARNVST